MSSFNLSVFFLALFLSLFSQADVADEYEKYVNAVVPRSKEVAKQDAFLRELAVFVDRMSVAQSSLANASLSAVLITDYSLRLTPPGKDACPRAKDDTIDLRETISQIFSVSQVINYKHELAAQLKNYRTLELGLDTACVEASQFDRYEIANIGISLYFPKGIEAFDGVYLVYGTGDRKRADQSDGSQREEAGFSAVPIIGSAYQFIHNLFQDSKLNELKGRLVKELVKNSDYRGYAKEACQTLSKTTAREAFAAEAPLAINLAIMNEKIDENALVAHRRKLELCLDRYETEVLDLFKEEAKSIADKTFGPELDELKAAKVAVTLHTRIGLAALTLEREARCAAGAETARNLDGDLALLQIYLGHQPDEAKFIEAKRKALESWKQTCDVKEKA